MGVRHWLRNKKQTKNYLSPTMRKDREDRYDTHRLESIQRAWKCGVGQLEQALKRTARNLVEHGPRKHNRRFG